MLNACALLDKNGLGRTITLLELGKSQREIERVTGIDRKTIRSYQHKFQTERANSPGVATGGSPQTPPPRPPAELAGTSACEPWREFIEAFARPPPVRGSISAAGRESASFGLLTVVSPFSCCCKPRLHGALMSLLHSWLGASGMNRRCTRSGATGRLCCTAKYRPEFPASGFADLRAARECAREFVHWYNHDHRHSGIRYVSPAQRHAGEDVAILTARHEVYLQARERNPARWSGNTRDWSHIATVSLNPERDSIVAAASRRENIQPLAA